MDNKKKPPVAELYLSPKQKDLVNELEIQYGLRIQPAKKRDPKWAVQFLNLFAFNPKLPIDDASQRGWRIVQTVMNDYYWTDYFDNTARKLDITEKEVKFVLSTLLNFRIKPLVRAPANTDRDPEDDVFNSEYEHASD